MSNFGYTYPFYRDPREEQAALDVLARMGRRPDGPTPEQRAVALGALARGGLVPDAEPAAHPPAPELSPADVARAMGISALARAYTPPSPPEPDPEPEPTPDPEVEATRNTTAYGALRRAMPEQEPVVSEPEPDPEVERLREAGAAGALSRIFGERQAAAKAAEPKPVDQDLVRKGIANAAGRLASTGREMEPPPPRKPPPIPLEIRDRPIVQRMIEESDRAWSDRKPDMVFTRAEAAKGFDQPKDTAVVELPEVRVVGSRESDQPIRRVDLPELNVVGYREDAPPPVREVFDKVAKVDGKPVETTTVVESKPPMADKPEPDTNIRGIKLEVDPKLERGVRDSLNYSAPVAEDKAPEVNQWALALDLMTNGGRGVPNIIALANSQQKAWEDAKRQKIADDQHRQTFELNKGNLEARNREAALQEKRSGIELDKLEHPEKYVKPETPQEKAEREFKEWQQTDASQRGWASQDAMDAERRADNARADASLNETKAYHGYLRAQASVARDEKSEKINSDFALKYQDKTKKTQEAAHSLATIDAIVKKYEDRGESVPGLGMVDTNTPGIVTGVERAVGHAFDYKEMEERARDADILTNARENLTNSLIRHDTGATVVGWERLAERARAGNSRLATAEQQKDAIEAVREAVHGDLRGFGAGNVTVARKVLADAGIDPDKVWVGAPRSAGASPRSSDDSSDAGETADTRHDVILTNPHGKVTTNRPVSLSNAEIENDLNKGWKVQPADNLGTDKMPAKPDFRKPATDAESARKKWFKKNDDIMHEFSDVFE